MFALKIYTSISYSIRCLFLMAFVGSLIYEITYIKIYNAEYSLLRTEITLQMRSDVFFVIRKSEFIQFLFVFIVEKKHGHFWTFIQPLILCLYLSTLNDYAQRSSASFESILNVYYIDFEPECASMSLSRFGRYPKCSFRHGVKIQVQTNCIV